MTVDGVRALHVGIRNRAIGWNVCGFPIVSHMKKSTGVGLSNIKQRYDLLTNKKVNINKEANRFAVAIPMLTKKISVQGS